MLREVLPDGSRVTTLEGVARCEVAPRHDATTLGMHLRETDLGRTASLTGVQHCHSQMCPACLPVDAMADAREIARVGRLALARGWGMLHLIATAHHTREHTAAQVEGAVQAGWEALTASVQWRDVQAYGVTAALELERLRADLSLRRPERTAARREVIEQATRAGLGQVAWVRAPERTWGPANGHHGHLHALTLMREDPTEAQVHELRAVLLRSYRRGLEAHGLRCDEEHGLRIVRATDQAGGETVLSRYITKIGLEVTRPDLKTAKTVERIARNGRRIVERRYGPFDLLRVVAGGLDLLKRYGVEPAEDEPGWVTRSMRSIRRSLALWRELEQATKGRPRLRRGGCWDELVNELEPEEVDAGEPAELPEGVGGGPDAPDMVIWDPMDHARVVRNWPEIAHAAEVDGWPAAIAILDRLGVRWRWWWSAGPPPSASGAPHWPPVGPGSS